MKSKTAFPYLLLLIVFLFAGINAQGQRRNKSTTAKTPEQIQQEEEYYFIEAEKQYLLKNYSRATESYNRCLSLNAENDVVYYKLAEIGNVTEQYNEAAKNINKALSLNQKNKYYYLLAVDIFTNLGDLNSSADMYEKMIKELPETSAYLFNLAAVYIYLKDMDKALATYQRAEDEFGLTEDIAFQRQKIYLQQNKLEEAIAEGMRLIAEYPGNERYVLVTAEILTTNNRLEDAASLLNSLLEKEPDFSPARLQLADIYWKESNFDAFENELFQAFQDKNLNLNAKINTLMKYLVYLPNKRLEVSIPKLARVLVDIHPDDGNAYLIAGDVLTTMIDKNLVANDDLKSTRKEAAGYYSKFVAIDPSRFAVWQNLLNLDLQLDAQDSLAVHAEAALEYFPNQAWLYLVNGIAKHNQNKLNAAAESLEMGAKRASGNKQLLLAIYGYLGDIYNEIKDYAKSDKSYEKVLELDPLNYTVLNNYSYYLSLREERLERAKEMCATLIKGNPDNPTFLDTYAWVHYKMGNYEEARRVFEKIMDLGVDDGVYFDHYGDTLYQLGLTNEAIEQWKKARELDETIDNIDEKINKGKIIQ